MKGHLGFLVEFISPAVNQAREMGQEGYLLNSSIDTNVYNIVKALENSRPVHSEKVEAGERQVQLRDISVRIEPSDSTIVNAQERLETIRRAAQTEGLEKAGATAGLEVKVASGVTAAGIAPGLSAIPSPASGEPATSRQSR